MIAGRKLNFARFWIHYLGPNMSKEPKPPSKPEDEKIQKKRDELLEKLMGKPTEEELRQLQLHLDVIEKWREGGRAHDDVDHGHQETHEHDHHA
jgi:hypothetical protein